MRCLNPVQLSYAGAKPDGKVKLVWGAGRGISDDHPENRQIGCGKCEACVITAGEELATRIVCESRMHEWSWFFTLTYDPEFMPADGKVSKAHAYDWRIAMRSAFPGLSILLVGEYGERTERPHYHAAVFGVDFTPICTNAAFGASEPMLLSDQLQRIWGRGNVLLSPLQVARCRYIGSHFIKSYGRDDTFVSYPRPAIGDSFRREYWDDVARNGVLHFDGQAFRTPRQWYNATPDDRYAKVREKALAHAVQAEADLVERGGDPVRVAQNALLDRKARLGLKKRII
ncbi:MAG: putative replication initiation protein [Microviridae sp.]|nr:MAG: putative replication initiation protein [Microviridae sp.]